MYNRVNNFGIRKIILFSLMLFLLASCGEEEAETEAGNGEVEILDFFVSSTNFGDFEKEYSIKKIGKINSSQSVKLSSNAVGRVKNIYVKEGQYVKKGTLLASLDDNIGSYGINIQKASNGVSRAKINYDSQKIALDKQVDDAELSLDRLEKNLENLKKSTEQSIKKAENDLENLDPDSDGTTSSLDVKKIDNNIAKLELDYENKLIADGETIEGFKANLKNEYNSLILTLDDIIEFSDTILGVTHDHEDDNDKFEDYLGAKNKIQKGVSEASLRSLMSYRSNEITTLFITDLLEITNEEIEDILYTLGKGYELKKVLLAELEKTFNNSISSVGSLSELDIVNYVASINGYQSSNQGSYSAFTIQENSIKSFLRTYINTQSSLSKQVDLLKEDRAILIRSLGTGEFNSEIGLTSTVIQAEDSVINLESQIESTKLALENAKKSRVVALQSLNNSIIEANIAYSSAARERSKLSIYAPISGTIGGILIDLGQEVSNGIALFNIDNNSENEIEIGLNNEEIKKISIGDKVSMVVDGEELEGEIYSISAIADSNLNFKTLVALDSSLKQLGKLVEVHIPIDSEQIVVPLNIVNVDSSGSKGFLNTLEEDKTFSRFNVVFGAIYGDKIEILSCEDTLSTEVEEGQEYISCEVFNETRVVTNNISNFDSSKYRVIEK